jgi:hypothetical protein
MDAPRVDVNSFQKIWAALSTKAAVNMYAEAVISKLYIVFPFGMTQKNTLPKNKN